MNHESFEQTTLPHMATLRYYAQHLTLDSENAQDLLQETYLKAYRFWGRFEEGTNIKAWLRQIMKNSHINRYRKETKKPKTLRYEEHHIPYGVSLDKVANSDNPLHKSYDEVFGDEIMCSIESISATFREVIMLGDVEGFTYEEIALTLGCPMGTVRSRLHRGRKILRKKLFAYARENGYVSEHVSSE
jgi:RNA polymerase sigma-70 factor, ECF subfamily